MHSEVDISFIGAGNVAWHLAVALEAAGYQVREIYSRTLEHATALADKLYNATPTQSLDFSGSKATVFFIAVPDSQVAQIAAALKVPEKAIVAHTSGSLPLEVLQDHEYRGVFYPLQTFSKHTKLDIHSVPFCLETSDESTELLLVEMAQQISQTVYLVNSAERKVLHIGAVFACNFTNHLLGIAKNILDREDLEFDLLKPLIQETVQKALHAGHPAYVQTGPANRNDQQIIDQHIDYLSAYPSEQHIYRTLTESIRHSK
ncbi:F420-dependent NADP oxidoreductase [Rhodocytophaga aerolata]|uniref:F420-dependent NADP oxidoreductase n=1 Tax=Rhodocytophaga aerolata TaxID=455078 RepID=A0ABT8R318_9BACT|nr:Rossmann-like and DUF2520 domain-containing protein [Rhodocytophaga aerolata]MDO1445588.1 F420-dependent NADP oxidoreductase [Rhodocytophaga aerolata]